MAIPTTPPSSDSPTLQELFNSGRMKKGYIPLSHKIFFLLYLPFGIVLLLVRSLVFFIMCLGMLTLPRKIGDPLTQTLLLISTGIIVRRNKVSSNVPHIVTCNHVSDFDSFAIWFCIGRYTSIASSHLRSIPIVGKTYESMDCVFVAPNPESKEQLKNTIKDRLAHSPYPIMIFPEGGLTSGKRGTLLYQKFVFSLDCGIVPCAVALKDPWPVENDYLGSSWGKNFFWFMILPYHVYEMTFLPMQFRQENETPEEFAYRVQTMTSQQLGIVATKHPYSMKKELVKQLREQQKQQRQQQLQQKEKST